MSIQPLLSLAGKLETQAGRSAVRQQESAGQPQSALSSPSADNQSVLELDGQLKSTLRYQQATLKRLQTGVTIREMALNTLRDSGQALADEEPGDVLEQFDAWLAEHPQAATNPHLLAFRQALANGSQDGLPLVLEQSQQALEGEITARTQQIATMTVASENTVAAMEGLEHSTRLSTMLMAFTGQEGNQALAGALTGQRVSELLG